MLSHITVGTNNDLDQAAVFYDAILSSLGLVRREVMPDGGPPALCWVSLAAPLPRFYVYSPLDKKSASPGNGAMVAFLAPSPSAVEEAFERGIENGGTSEGLPGPRPRYGDGYFGAYLRDPDGNKLHIVHRGDIVSAPNSQDP